MSLAGSRFSSDSTPRPFHHGIRRRGGTIFFGRPRRQCDCRFKRTYELTSSVAPRGTSFHPLGGARFPPIAFDPAQISSRRDLPSPPQLANPHAVHDHGQPTRQSHDRLFHPGMPGDLHRPGLEPGPIRRTHQHALGSSASSRLHTVISRRFARSGRIDTWRVSVQTPPPTALEFLKRAGTSTLTR